MRRPAGQFAKALSHDRVYVVRSGLARGFRRRGGTGWIPALLRPETEEHRFLRSLRLTGCTVYDVGAFEGMLSLFFWRATGPQGAVISFEPNPQSRSRMRANLALNEVDSVQIEAVALGDQNGAVEIRFDPTDAGRSSVAGYEDGDAGELVDAQVPMHRLADLVRERGLPLPDLVKIDVEGHELEVVAGAVELLREHRPALFIELHGTTLPERRAVHEPMYGMLRAEGYSVTHVESGRLLPARSLEFPKGHVWCEHVDSARTLRAC